MKEPEMFEGEPIEDWRVEFEEKGFNTSKTIGPSEEDEDARMRDDDDGMACYDSVTNSDLTSK